jgi:hypothetical protein
VRNEYSIIKVLVFVSTVTVILSLTYVTHEGRAIPGTTNSSSLTEAVQLGAPFYVQHYKANLVKPEPSQESIAGNFTGQGILNGNLSISAEVNFTRTFRDNDTAFLQGDTKFVAENGDTATYSYDAFTNYNQDGTSEGRGVAVFDDGATGDLSFLSNTLAIYKNWSLPCSCFLYGITKFPLIWCYLSFFPFASIVIPLMGSPILMSVYFFPSNSLY